MTYMAYLRNIYIPTAYKCNIQCHVSISIYRQIYECHHQIFAHSLEIRSIFIADMEEDIIYNLHSLQWRHNGHHGLSNHRRLDCLLNSLCRRRSKKTSKLRVTGLNKCHFDEFFFTDCTWKIYDIYALISGAEYTETKRTTTFIVAMSTPIPESINIKFFMYTLQCHDKNCAFMSSVYRPRPR